MEKEVLRKEIFLGKVILTDKKHQTIIKMRNILFKAKNTLYMKKIEDLLYNSPNYKTIPSLEYYLDMYNDKYNNANITIYNIINLNKLLRHFGFDKILSSDEILLLYENLFKSNITDTYYMDFGYQKRNKWCNGFLVENMSSINDYYLEKENDISSYFKVLYLLNHTIDLDESFIPFKEESIVRERKI
jgi:hypothetical protein